MKALFALLTSFAIMLAMPLASQASAIIGFSSTAGHVSEKSPEIKPLNVNGKVHFRFGSKSKFEHHKFDRKFHDRHHNRGFHDRHHRNNFRGHHRNRGFHGNHNRHGFHNRRGFHDRSYNRNFRF